jgi:hypothetical protein
MNCCLHGIVDVEVLEFALDVRAAVLQIKESLRGSRGMPEGS